MENVVDTARYFCVGSGCEGVQAEVPRDPGLDYYQPAGTTISIVVGGDEGRPMCVCVDRASGAAYFCPTDLEDTRENNADMRVETGCRFFGGAACIEVQGDSGEGHFGPIRCEGNFEDKRIETGFELFSVGSPVTIEGTDAMGYYGPAVRKDENLMDVRADTGCEYYGTGPCVDVVSELASQDEGEDEEQEEDEEAGGSEVDAVMEEHIPPGETEVKYFCPGSCEDLAPQKPRDTGCKEFGLGASCEDLLDRKHVLFLRGEGEDNSSDVRQLTGCQYFSAFDTCIEVVRDEKGNFGPARCEDDNSAEIRTKTGCMYFGGGVPCVDVPCDEDISREGMGCFGPLACEDANTSDVRTLTGIRFFSSEGEITRPVGVRSQSLFGPDGYEGNTGYDRTQTGLDCFRPWSPPLSVVQHATEGEFGFSGEPNNTSDIRRATGIAYYGLDIDDVTSPERLMRVEEPGERGFNTFDVRTATGCRYFSDSSCVDIVALRELLDVRYFCPRHCHNVDVERPRETGQRFFDPENAEPKSEEASVHEESRQSQSQEMETIVNDVRYFCSGSCGNVAAERWRDTGCMYYGPESCEGAGEYFGSGGREDNSIDVRVQTGCQYYSGRRRCIEVIGEGCVSNCVEWTVEQVGDWIQAIGFKQYRDCFERNVVCGRRLILINASTLPSMGISNIDDIKEIAREIRDLLYVDPVAWDRSIALPPSDERSLFLDRKCMTGRNTDKLTFDKFHDDWEQIKFQPPLSNHAALHD